MHLTSASDALVAGCSSGPGLLLGPSPGRYSARLVIGVRPSARGCTHRDQAVRSLLCQARQAGHLPACNWHSSITAGGLAAWDRRCWHAAVDGLLGATQAPFRLGQPACQEVAKSGGAHLKDLLGCLGQRDGRRHRGRGLPCKHLHRVRVALWLGNPDAPELCDNAAHAANLHRPLTGSGLTGAACEGDSQLSRARCAMHPCVAHAQQSCRACVVPSPGQLCTLKPGLMCLGRTCTPKSMSGCLKGLLRGLLRGSADWAASLGLTTLVADAPGLDAAALAGGSLHIMSTSAGHPMRSMRSSRPGLALEPGRHSVEQTLHLCICVRMLGTLAWIGAWAGQQQGSRARTRGCQRVAQLPLQLRLQAALAGPPPARAPW